MGALDLSGTFRGARVFLTGHTGFKGSWAVAMLRELGSRLTGYSLPPPTTPSLFEHAQLLHAIDGEIGDIADREALFEAMQQAQPDLVLHLAAQPLVLDGIEDPVSTFSTNVQGTVHVLDAVRRLKCVKAAIIVTSDKCYRPSLASLREGDPLGGEDPYSGSKAAAEIAVDVYRHTYFGDCGPVIASVRAGNVVGGGDWSRFRLVPDIVKALHGGETLTLRHPHAIRPWQHVADALSGYFRVAERALHGDRSVARAWNFGPAADAHIGVRDFVERFMRAYGASCPLELDPVPHAENPTLLLDSADARTLLGWRPQLDIDETIAMTAEFYRLWADGAPVAQILRRQARALLSAHGAAA